MYALRSFYTVFLCSCIFICIGQPCATEIKVIGTKAAFLEDLKKNPEHTLVRLQEIIPGLIVSMPYATTNNFTKGVLYHHPVAYLCAQPAAALKQAQLELNKQGLGLKIFDAYRPFSITCRMWRLVPDRRYVANPRNGSNHNRGVAIDVTLVDIKTGNELDMGTSFDNFTESAHHDFYLLDPKVVANRRLLKAIMRKYGFGYVPTEWWHYQWKNRQGYEVLDLDFDALKTIVE